MLILNNQNELVNVNNDGLIVAYDKAGNIRGVVVTNITDESCYTLVSSSTSEIDEIGNREENLDELIAHNSDFTFKFIPND